MVTIDQRILNLIQIDKVNDSHPGWQEQVIKPRFMNWLNSEDVKVKALIESMCAHDAITVLDRYSAYITELEASAFYQWGQRKTAAGKSLW